MHRKFESSLFKVNGKSISKILICFVWVQCSTSITPENIRKTKFFWKRFPDVLKGYRSATSAWNWLNCYLSDRTPTDVARNCLHITLLCTHPCDFFWHYKIPEAATGSFSKKNLLTKELKSKVAGYSWKINMTQKSFLKQLFFHNTSQRWSLNLKTT